MRDKVVVPKFVDSFFYEFWEGREPTAWDKVDLIKNQEQCMKLFGNEELENWFTYPENFILFTNAVMDGYEVEKEPNELDHLIAIYKISGRNFELAIRRYIVQKDFTNSLLIDFLNYLDMDDKLYTGG